MNSSKTPFRYVIPAHGRATEYEELTLHSQWSPYNFAKQGWFNRGNGGKPPWSDDSTKLHCMAVAKPESWWYSVSRATEQLGPARGHNNVIRQAAEQAQAGWWGYRDPSRQWFRPYVEKQAAQENMIEMATANAVRLGLYKRISQEWLAFLKCYYAAYRYVEYGLFLALCYAQREALSDVVATPVLFQAIDKERHAQAIALHCMALEEAVGGFSDAAAKEAWLGDKILQPLRRYVELLLACRDWAEVTFAINLAFEPLVGRLFTNCLVAQQGAAYGDPVTPLIAGSADVDRERALAAAAELARFVIANVPDNKAVIENWLRKWVPEALGAVDGLQPLAELSRGVSADLQRAVESIKSDHSRLMLELGLKLSEIVP